MNRRLNAGLSLVLVLAPARLAAQAVPQIPLDRPAPKVTVSLAEALGQARANSPAYRQVLNDAGPAGVAVRNAYGKLLPTFGVGGNVGYSGDGKSTFGGETFNQVSAAVTSGYGMQLDLNISGSTILGPGTQKANQRAVEEDILSAGIGLNNDITAQYLSVLQAAAQADVARQQVRRNSEFLELAKARFQVGQATLLDVRQAEVTKGQSEVQLLQAVQTENEAKIELVRRMGVELPVPVSEMALSDSFALSEPRYDLQMLLKTADEENPTLRALRAREDASRASARSAKSQYLPSLSASAVWQGYTQEFTNTGLLLNGQVASAKVRAANCTFQNDLIGALPGGGIPGYPNGGQVPDCKSFAGLDATGEALNPELEQALLARNNVWPLDFNNQPFRANLQISVPIFQGFSRNLDVARANAAREDAEETTRARRLQVLSDVQARYLGLQAAWQATAVQSSNRSAAREQLQLAQERFRLGSGNALEVTDAQAAVARAEGDYVNAVYAYHKAIAALEYAVGRPLR
jgi:outer membrane protein TolC